MAHLRGVILDVDGTLVDSNDAHAHSWAEAFAEYNYTISLAKIRSLIGMGADNLLPETVRLDKDSAQGQAIAQRYLEIFEARYLPTLKAFPGVRALLTRMHEQGLKLVIGSSSETEVLDRLLQIAGVKDLIDNSVSSKDAKNAKPDPDTVQIALKKLGCSPNETLLIGDTPYDVRSAAKAGVQTIMLRCGGWQDADLEEALAIYDSPADLLAHYNASPLAAASV